MKREEQNPASIGGSYQCNFVLLSRKEKIKGTEDVSGRESVEGFSPSDNKTVKKEGV